MRGLLNNDYGPWDIWFEVVIIVLNVVRPTTGLRARTPSFLFLSFAFCLLFGFGTNFSTIFVPQLLSLDSYDFGERFLRFYISVTFDVTSLEMVQV